MSSIIDDAGLREPPHEAGPVFIEDPIPEVSRQGMPPQETEVGTGFKDDSHEILFDDGDWDVDSNTVSVVSIERID